MQIFKILIRRLGSLNSIELKSDSEEKIVGSQFIHLEIDTTQKCKK